MRVRLAANKVNKHEKDLSDLEKDESIVIMKTDKGNCFVVMGRSDYDKKMKTLLDDKTTYETMA